MAAALLLSHGLAAEASVEEIVSSLSNKIDEANRFLDAMEIPPLILQLFGNETVNIFIDMDDGTTETVGVKTVNGRLEGIVYGGYASPTLHVFVSEQTVREIAYSESPIETGVAALETGKIKYQGVGLFNFIRFSFVGIFQSIMRFLSSFA
jgi:ribosomal protein L25 (general stress protein Ctc)